VKVVSTALAPKAVAVTAAATNVFLKHRFHSPKFHETRKNYMFLACFT
jgi:hypothetical protein